MPALPNNSHIHLPPNFSAFESPAHALDLCVEQGLKVVGLSNYYDFSVYREFAHNAESRGVFTLLGLEIIALIPELAEAGIKLNDPGNPGKMYICGKGIVGAMPGRATRLLQTIRDNDSSRMSLMVDLLEELCSSAGMPTGLTAAAIRASIASKYACPVETVYLQERHLAQAFQEALFSASSPDSLVLNLARLLPTETGATPSAVQTAIRSQLMKAGKPAYAPETFVGIDHAIELIVALGGIPCYPVLADGASPITAFEQTPEELVENIQGMGFHFAEFIPLRNSPETLSRYVHAIRAAGIPVTAGTEHNTPDCPPMVPTCLGGAPIPEDIQEIFWEGACVALGHQRSMAANGDGFVGPDGELDPFTDSAEERIGIYRILGETMLG